MKKQLLVLVYLLSALSYGWAQSITTPEIIRCATSLDEEKLKKSDPAAYQRRLKIEKQTQDYIKNKNGSDGFLSTQRVTDPQVTITIPVVVHVLFNNNEQNISDAQIRSQISILNQDFRRLNGDRFQTPAEFSNVASDANIEFQLACVDPNGGVTTGIRRIFTNQTGFNIGRNGNTIDEALTGIKFVPGAEAWPPGRYLNIWVCNITNGVAGYGTFPGTATPATDGVVITYNTFGSIGTLQAPYNRGRTATHEVGHWLNLQHTFGERDDLCDDDLVNDTPLTQAPTFGCPNGQVFSCGGSSMFQNYMDYTDDACMNLFTNGQRDRMRALFVAGGFRETFISAKIRENYAQICSPGNVTFSVAANQGAFVNYQWSVSGALQLSSGQGTTQISCSQNGTVGTATITVSANGYCDTRTVRVGTEPTGYYNGGGNSGIRLQTVQFVTPSQYSIFLDQPYNFTFTSSNPSVYLSNSVGSSTSFYLGANMGTTIKATATNAPCTMIGQFVFSTSGWYTYSFAPNPVSDELTVTATELPSASDASADRPATASFAAELYDDFGRKVKTQSSTQSKAVLNVRDVPNGLYHLRVSQGKEVITERIQIVH